MKQFDELRLKEGVTIGLTLLFSIAGTAYTFQIFPFWIACSFSVGIGLLATSIIGLTFSRYSAEKQKAYEKMADDTIAAFKNTFESELDDGPPEVGVFYVDKDLNFCYMNREMRRICGYKYREIEGRKWTFMCSRALSTWLNNIVTKWMDDIMPIARPYITIRTKTGAYVKLLAFISLMEQPDNNTKFQVIVNIVPMDDDDE
ncbi:PAS domain S-box-containing protein [Chitinophaga jiangningensis]|uniref:PAS domain S-box-containing protein n=1 Tax=Chitinophaga jiangningensis TaxID=1419482 RepID=A0A1M7BV27_9BACT|nr:PAS domain-containing protein [Chitinophaga jiangningensis]SHL58862.1 PAS domain S-box-containing protein [Chitinophaga jiangningensis]